MHWQLVDTGSLHPSCFAEARVPLSRGLPPLPPVPALGGRTALQVYGDLMASFRSEMGPLLGTTITDVLVGLGPDGDLKYPAHPRDKRWTFPGVGEFQVSGVLLQQAVVRHRCVLRRWLEAEGWEA